MCVYIYKTACVGLSANLSPYCGFGFIVVCLKGHLSKKNKNPYVKRYDAETVSVEKSYFSYSNIIYICKHFFQNIPIRVLKDYCSSLKVNSHVLSFSLCNTRSNDSIAFALADMLKVRY